MAGSNRCPHKSRRGADVTKPSPFRVGLIWSRQLIDKTATDNLSVGDPIPRLDIDFPNDLTILSKPPRACFFIVLSLEQLSILAEKYTIMTQQLNAVRFRQWLDQWNDFTYDETQGRRKPDPHIYLFSMPAVQLRALSGVYRRKNGEGLQRMLDPKRAATIREFVRNGYPYSSLSTNLRTPQNDVLKKPGWLPTAIVVNILLPTDKRRGRSVAAGDEIKVEDQPGPNSVLTLPYGNSIRDWTPTEVEPLEVIDGQHRLWAFDDQDPDALPGDFELPVVAFRGLDIGWQAYLFWSINVSPKKINPSHAFDLFPLLRSVSWLETFSELRIYREARAQELTQLLNEVPDSVWFQRINMLGDKGADAPARAGVTQAGWVRSLTTSFLAPGGRGRGSDGLFAASTHGGDPLPWSRPQQAAILISLWDILKNTVAAKRDGWPAILRDEGERGFLPVEYDLAFEGTKTMLNQEQGVRGVLAVANDLLFAMLQDDRDYFQWDGETLVGKTTTIEDVQEELKAFKTLNLHTTVCQLAVSLASFDWRSANAPGPWDEKDHLARQAFRGSGGYPLLRSMLLAHVAESSGRAAAAAKTVIREDRR